MPVEKRGICGALTLRSGTGLTGAPPPAVLPPGPRRPAGGAAGRRASSTSVLHSPQAGQRPCHLADSCAQAEQT